MTAQEKTSLLVRMRWYTYQELIRQYKPLRDESMANYFERLVSSGILKERKK